MKNISLTQHRQTEKAIIDALLKISEIVQKTKSGRLHKKTINIDKCSKTIIGDGDYNQLHDDKQQVPIPPPTRTLDSYVSDFNQQSLQNPSNCNQASFQERSSKRHYSDNSSISTDHHRKKTSSQKSIQSNKMINYESENQPQTASYQLNSVSTTILDNQSSSSITIPIDPSIDQQLQETLEKHLKTHVLSSITTHHENNSTQRKHRSATLTKSETGRLIDNLDLNNQAYNSEYYEKQRELAMIATKQGDYSLSYSIYTNLLHDNQYDYKFKSEMLASRAVTLLYEKNYFESINDCTQAIAFNQWNKLAYVIRAACWMIKQEYLKAVDDYSKLFHFFDQSQHVLDLLNLAYEKLKLTNYEQQNKEDININSNQSVHSNNNALDSLISPLVWFKNPSRSF